MIRIGALIAVFILPLSMHAATFGISSPTAGEMGQTRSFVVTVYPAGETIYSVQADLLFDTAVLDILSVEYASGWLPLTQSGYDEINESQGVIVKTAGYPGGVNTPTVFATITTRLTGTGTGAVRTTSDTQVLNAESENVYTGNASGSVVIRAVPVAPAVSSEPTPEETVSIEPDTVSVRANTGDEAQLAAAGTAAGDFPFYPFGLIALALLIGVGALIGMIIALRRAQ